MRLSLPALMAAVLVSFEASAFEPVTALDDPFTIPSPMTLSESVIHHPGVEPFFTGTAALLARSVPFGVDDLAVTSATAARGFGRFGLSASFSGAGFDLYGDDTEKAGCSLLLGRGLSVGLRAVRYGIRMKGFGNASAWGADAGAVWRPKETLWIAGAVEDIAGAELGESREQVDGHVRASIAWMARPGAAIFVETVRVRRFDPSTSAGFIMEPVSRFVVGAAAGAEPDRIDFLAGVTVRYARCSYRGSFHSELGFTHGFSLGWGGRR